MLHTINLAPAKEILCSALWFEIDFEKNLNELCDDMLQGTYGIGRSCVFIVFNPVQREIFAADFRDRVVHHYLINKLEPILSDSLSTIAIAVVRERERTLE